MIARPAARKLALTAHVAASVGWLGAVAAFLALALTGAVSDDPEIVRAAYVAMEPAGWFVLLPLSLASLATGLLQSFTTRWGLVQHYWVVMKLVINVVSTAILLLYMQSLAHFADIARATPAGGNVGDLRSPSPILHAAVALALLLVATGLSVFKPRGLTRYGRRRAGQRL